MRASRDHVRPTARAEIIEESVHRNPHSEVEHRPAGRPRALTWQTVRAIVDRVAHVRIGHCVRFVRARPVAGHGRPRARGDPGRQATTAETVVDTTGENEQGSEAMANAIRDAEGRLPATEIAKRWTEVRTIEVATKAHTKFSFENLDI
ncbi:hypothetical protein GUJ93_ZPchr0013g36886 [Zizania palustris]|uniref:Uncharacterized protein n=1 Tax=Zizania palustris TaxID=103762 RepID=A0A8J5X2E3_ZIZPA|nr:hypothetical protein GUJ93_ZPchr0013g36886 [Zizania palustris]